MLILIESPSKLLPKELIPIKQTNFHGANNISKSLINLFINDIKFNDINGGSFTLFISKKIFKFHQYAFYTQ